MPFPCVCMMAAPKPSGRSAAYRLVEVAGMVLRLHRVAIVAALSCLLLLTIACTPGGGGRRRHTAGRPSRRASRAGRLLSHPDAGTEPARGGPFVR